MRLAGCAVVGASADSARGRPSFRRRRAPRRVDGRPRRVRVAVRDIHGRRRAEAPLLREDEVPPREDALRRRRPAMGRRRQERRAAENALLDGRRHVERDLAAARREDEGRRLGHCWRFREVRHGRGR